MLTNFPQVTQLVSGRARIRPRSASLQNHTASEKGSETLKTPTEARSI